MSIPGSRCESCGRVIRSKSYNADEDGITWHKTRDPECRPLSKRKKRNPAPADGGGKGS